MLWLVLAPGAKPFDPASAEPIQVDLLRSQDLPPEAKQEPPKSEEAKSEEPKPELPRPASRKSEPSKPSQDDNQMPALQDSAQ